MNKLAVKTIVSWIGIVIIKLQPVSRQLLLLGLSLCAASIAHASTINVPAGGNLQTAINNAVPGDEIVVQAGATYTGTITLPVKTGSSYITIRSSALVSLPTAGVRVTPANAASMPKITSATSGFAALQTLAGAHHYQFIGIEFKPVNSTVYVYDLVLLGAGDAAQNALSLVPHHLIFDRCYFHGDPASMMKRGIALNSADTQIVNSYISDIKDSGVDTQAICGWNGPGPFAITNNYIEASGNIVMFGGADPSITNLTPSDIDFRRNYVSRPVAWRPLYRVKNVFELKNAQRITVDGNVFENNWLNAQAGFAIVFTPRNDGGTAPWTVVQNVTFTNNIVRHSGSAINVLGQDYVFPSLLANHITIQNNLFDDISDVNWGGNGRFLQITEATFVTVEHNTVFHSGSIAHAYGIAAQGFIFRNNLSNHNDYGITGDNSGVGNNTLSTYFPGVVFAKNIIAMNRGNFTSLYPANNFFPALLTPSMFVDMANGNYRLVPTSPYHNAGTDGRDVGCDFNALDAAMSGAGPAPIPGALITDDFNDNSRDTSKWMFGTIQGAASTGPGAWDSAVPVLEQNQRLEVSPRASMAGDHFNSYVSVNYANLTNARASVQVVQVAPGAAVDTELALCLNSQNFYMIQHESGLLTFQQVIAGARSSTSVAFNAVQHKYWRIRHDAVSDSIVFETSPDGSAWTMQRTVARQLVVSALKAEIGAGTHSSVATPGAAIFDDFKLETNNGFAITQTAAQISAALVVVTDLLNQATPSRAQVMALASSIQSARTILGGDLARFNNAAAIDAKLLNALASANIATTVTRFQVYKRLVIVATLLTDAQSMTQQGQISFAGSAVTALAAKPPRNSVRLASPAASSFEPFGG